MDGKVLEEVTASAPPRNVAPASITMSLVAGVSLAHTGPFATSFTTWVTYEQRAWSLPMFEPMSSRSMCGQERFSSRPSAPAFSHSRARVRQWSSSRSLPEPAMIEAIRMRSGKAFLIRSRRGIHQSRGLSEMSSQFQDECSTPSRPRFMESTLVALSVRRNLVLGPFTLTTGCMPMVLVTTPPHPASKARRMLLSDSVGGAELSRNGLGKRIPVKGTERSAPMRTSLRRARRRRAVPGRIAENLRAPMPAMKTSLSTQALQGPIARLRRANAAFARRYPGDSADRQPVHTVYGGAQLFEASSARKLGEVALRTLRDHAPDADTLGDALGLPRELAARVHPRVMAKLEREAVEDFRIDFEDGYGNRPDDEEDTDAVRTAGEVAKGLAEGSLPPFIGIRIKPLSGELYPRSLRTLDLFVTALAVHTKGQAGPRLRGHHSQGHDPGARVHGVDPGGRPRAQAPPAPGRPEARADGGDAAVHLQ